MGEASHTGKRHSQPVLGPEFFDRNADTVARDLIGKELVRELEGTRNSYMITETEAYLGSMTWPATRRVAGPGARR